MISIPSQLVNDIPSAHASVVRFLRRRVRDNDLVDEMAQETMFRCVSRTMAPTGECRQPLGKLKAFAIRVAGNLWIDRMRRPELATVTSVDATTEPAEASTYRPSRVVGRGERQSAVQQAMARLSEDTQRVIRMRHEDDLSLKEIAADLGQAYEAVRKRYTRGLLELRASLERTASDVF